MALEFDLGAAAVGGVLRDDGDARGVVHAVHDGVRGESAEDDGVDGADARAGEQSDGQLRRHAHVDGDAIAFPDAERLQSVRGLRDFYEKFGVSDAADLAGLTLPKDGDLVLARAESMAVDGVVAEVQLAAGEPFGRREIAIEHLGEGRKPVEVPSRRCPRRYRGRRWTACRAPRTRRAIGCGLWRQTPQAVQRRDLRGEAIPCSCRFLWPLLAIPSSIISDLETVRHAA